MKIGILTLPLHTNYGGILQAYALQTVLERMGHQVVVLNYKKENRLPLWKLPLSYTKRIIYKYIFRRNDIRVFTEYHQKRESAIISQHIQRFIDKYIHSYDVKSFQRLRESDFDAIVVGSDQVWRPKYFTYLFNSKIEDAFLLFAQKWNLKRISYAASFGTDKWEYTIEETKVCAELLKFFDLVTVREESAVKLCKDKLGVDAFHVLDPTMLLSKDDYIKLFDVANTPKSNGNLLTYILDDNSDKTELINQISKEKGLIPFRVNSQIEGDHICTNDRIHPSVETWLRGFYDAEFIVTDSFHACVFSIIFGKPFVVIGNEERGMARFKSLLNMFGLEDCLITSLKDYTINNCDYTNLREYQEYSLKLLYDALC